MKHIQYFYLFCVFLYVIHFTYSQSISHLIEPRANGAGGGRETFICKVREWKFPIIVIDGH